jgi:hypothetical protein
MKKSLVAVLLIMALIPATLPAEMFSDLDIIGFSAGGEHLAYQISGYGTNSRRAFSLVQTVAVRNND